MPAPKGEDGLTTKQAAFVREYLIDLNATQAAIRAGYSAKTAGRVAGQVMQKPAVQQALRKAMNERSKKTEFSANDVLKELKNIVKFNIKSIFNPDGSLKEIVDLDDDVSSAISSIKTKHEFGLNSPPVVVTEIKIHDKNKAVDMAMRHFSLFNDKLNVNVTVQDVMAAFPEPIQKQIREALAKKIG